MTDADQEPEIEQEDVEGDGEEDGAKKSKFSHKFLMLFVALPMLLIVGLGAGGAWYMGWLGGDAAEPGETAEAAPAKPAFFYDLPEMLVNLSGRDSRAKYLKLQVALEMSDEDIVSALEPVLPRIIDTFQVYLRELRSGDLEGSVGVYRLKEELLRRVNLSIAPRKVDRVLFKEIIIQ